MSSTYFSSVPPSTPALLALKRFVRGALRQVGIGFASLLLLLNVSAHLPNSLSATTESMTAASSSLSVAGPSSPQAITSRSPASQVSGLWPSHAESAEALADRSSNVSDASQPTHVLGAHMTYHRLTGARLSIPSASASAPQRFTLATLADEQ